MRMRAATMPQPTSQTGQVVISQAANPSIRSNRSATKLPLRHSGADRAHVRSHLRGSAVDRERGTSAAFPALQLAAGTSARREQGRQFRPISDGRGPQTGFSLLLCGDRRGPRKQSTRRKKANLLRARSSPSPSLSFLLLIALSPLTDSALLPCRKAPSCARRLPSQGPSTPPPISAPKTRLHSVALPTRTDVLCPYPLCVPFFAKPGLLKPRRMQICWVEERSPGDDHYCPREQLLRAGRS